MSKFKVGDRVCNSYAEYTVDHVDGGRVYYTGGGYDMERTVTLVKSATPSLDNLSVDDVVVNDDGEEFTVVGVFGRLVFVEDGNGHANGYFTVKELKDNDFTVIGAEEALTELTLPEIAEKFNIPTDKLRIKK
jgi:hypothetical protein